MFSSHQSSKSHKVNDFLLCFTMPAKANNLSWLGPGMMAPVVGKFEEPAHYKLHGVLYHHGKSPGSGHYTADVLRRNGDGGSGETWMHVDDEVLSAVRYEDVFGSHDNERVDGRCAYMLFYCRTTPT